MDGFEFCRFSEKIGFLMAPGDHLDSLFEVILAPESIIVPKKASHKPSKRHLKNSIKKMVKKIHGSHAGRGPGLPLRLKKPEPDPDPDPGPGPQNHPCALWTLHFVPKGTVADFLYIFSENQQKPFFPFRNDTVDGIIEAILWHFGATRLKLW